MAGFWEGWAAETSFPGLYHQQLIPTPTSGPWSHTAAIAEWPLSWLWIDSHHLSLRHSFKVKVPGGSAWFAQADHTPSSWCQRDGEEASSFYSGFLSGRWGPDIPYYHSGGCPATWTWIQMLENQKVATVHHSPVRTNLLFTWLVSTSYTVDSRQISQLVSSAQAIIIGSRKQHLRQGSLLACTWP